MGRVRFVSFTWLLLIPLFAAIKIAWELSAHSSVTHLAKPIPISWLDTQLPLNIFIGVATIFIATYLVFIYINAYINLQTTYTVALFFGILTLLSFTPQLTSSLFATLLFLNGILNLLALDEKKRGVFIVFDTGFCIGIALLFDAHFLLLAIILSLFLFFLQFSFRHFLQYWAGVFVPLLLIFPILYFLDLLPNWENYFIKVTYISLDTLSINLIDYVLIGILLIFCTFQAFSLSGNSLKPTQRLLLPFLFIYFLLSLFIGIFIYSAFSGAYILFIIPSITILYSLSKHNNQQIPIFLMIVIIMYWSVQLLQQFSIF